MINSYEFYNRVAKTEQSIYDSYNKVIFSADTRVINKMVKRIELYQQIKELPGDIVEVGVFKGAGLPRLPSHVGSTHFRMYPYCKDVAT